MKHKPLEIVVTLNTRRRIVLSSQGGFHLEIDHGNGNWFLDNDCLDDQQTDAALTSASEMLAHATKAWHDYAEQCSAEAPE